MTISTTRNVSDCPFCGTLQNAASAVSRDGKPLRPQPGNASICAKCLGVSVFDNELNRRRPTPEEQAHLDANPEIQFILSRLRAVGPQP